MFTVKQKRSSNLGVAKFVAVRPWMIDFNFETANELYVFAYIWNCIDHFGQLRMDTQGDLVRCGLYINMDPNELSMTIQKLLTKNYIDTYTTEEDETFITTSVGEEWFGHYNQ